MADFLAITFDGTDDAEAALKSVRALQGDGRIKLEDTAVVRKDAAGTVTIHNEASSGTETGAVVGAVLGGLLFVVFPPAGVVVGAVAGGAIGRAAPPASTVRSSRRWATTCRPAARRCSCQIKGGDTGLLIGAMRQYHGRVRQTSLPDEVETALDESLR